MGRNKKISDSRKPGTITARLSESDMTGLEKIKESGGFEEISSALRWCIHFTVAMMRTIPAAVIEAVIVTEEDDQVEENTGEVLKQAESKTQQMQTIP